MLLFVDQPKQIRVIRTVVDNGVTSRAPIGRIRKHLLEITEDLRVELSKDEVKEVEAAIDNYKRAESLKAEYYSLNFPAIVRDVMDRFEEGATDSERQLVMGALMEAVRRMRKFQRDLRPE